MICMNSLPKDKMLITRIEYTKFSSVSVTLPLEILVTQLCWLSYQQSQYLNGLQGVHFEEDDQECEQTIQTAC